MTGVPPPRSPLVFTGTAAEYFKIWIVNVCLTLLTLGIYSAWAKVRQLRYFHGSTSLEGHPFGYTADPVRILKGRVVAVAALLFYLAATNFAPRVALGILSLIILLTPALIVVAARFNLRNTTYRNVRFDIDAGIHDAYRLFIVPLFVLVAGAWGMDLATENSDFVRQMETLQGDEFHREDLFSTYLFMGVIPLLPLLDYLRVRFLLDRIRWGSVRFRYEGNFWRFYEVYIVAGVILTALILMLFGAGMVIALVMRTFATFTGATPEAGPEGGNAMLIGLAAALAVYLSTVMAAGYLRARRSNVILCATRVGTGSLHSDLGAWSIGWLYATNTLAILLSAGLLIPWATVRAARYVAGHTAAVLDHADVAMNTGAAAGSALGEEMVDAFDVDIGI